MAKGKGSGGRKSFHVVKSPSGGWGVKAAGGKTGVEHAQDAGGGAEGGDEAGQVGDEGADGRA